MTGYWQHERSMDCFIEVLKVQWHGPDYMKLKIRWWNKGQTGNPWCLWITQKVKIYYKDLSKWQKLDFCGIS